MLEERKRHSGPNIVQDAFKKTKRLRALNTVYATCNQSLNLKEVLRYALESTIEVLGVEAGDISLADNETKKLVPVANIGLPDELIKDLTYRDYGVGLCGHVAKSAMPVIVSDLDKDPRVHSGTAKRERYGSYIGIPLQAKSSLVGVMELVSHRVHEITQEDIDWLMSIGHAVGMAIENAKLYESLKAQTERLHKAILLLEESSSLFTAMQDPDRLFNSVIRSSQLLLGTEYVALVLTKPVGGGRDLLLSEELERLLDDPSVLRDFEELSSVAEQGVKYRELESQDGHNGDIRAKLLGRGFRGVLSLPLLYSTEYQGSIIALIHEVEDWSEHDKGLFQVFANQVSIAFANLCLYHVQKEMAQNLRDQKLVAERQNELLTKIVRVHDELTRIVLEQGQIGELAAALSGIVERPVAIVNQDWEPICWAGVQDRDPSEKLENIAGLRIHMQEVRDSLKREVRALELKIPNGPMKYHVIAPIVVSDELMGYVIALGGDHEFQQSDLMSIEHSTTAIALEMVREKIAWEVEARLRGELVDDILSGNYSDPSFLLERAKRLGRDLSKLNRAIAIYFRIPLDGQENARNRLHQVVKRMTEDSYPGSLVASKGDNTVILLASGSSMLTGGHDRTQQIKRFCDRLREKVSEFPYPLRATIGIGGHADKIGELGRSYQEARQCLEIARAFQIEDKTISFEELGISGLLLSVANKEKLLKFVDDALGPLLSYDGKRSTSLVRTLEAFLDNGCNLKATSAALFIHLNTLLYRLKRIEEIGEIDLKNPETRLSLHMALKISRLINAIKA